VDPLDGASTAGVNETGDAARTLQALRFVAGPHQWIIPLSGSAARAFCQQLLRDPAVSRSTRHRSAIPGLRRACREDPALILWALLQWHAHDELPPAAPPTPDQVACWLAVHLSHLLSDRRSGIATTASSPLRDVLRAAWWDELRFALRSYPAPAARSLPAAWCNARDWLAGCGPAADPGWLAGLPQWLRGERGTETLPLPRQNTEKQASAGYYAIQNSGLWPAVRLARQLRRTDRLERRFARRLQSAKLASLAQLAYGLSHEINNPLANIAARASAAARLTDDEALRSSLRAIESQAFRAHEMIADLMLFARPPAPRVEPLDLVSLVHEVCGDFFGSDSTAGDRWQLRAPTSAVAPVDRTQFREALRAVLQNAVEADQTGRPIRIIIRRIHPYVGGGNDRSRITGHATMVRVAVIDRGPGLSEAAQQHAFDPYFSGREAGRGLGLGLSKVHRILRAHKGSVRIRSRPTGCRVDLDWPND